MDSVLVAATSTRTSKAAVWSFVLGLLMCIPVLTAVPAVILGIVGIGRTGRPGIRGRWMAVAGMVLGLLSLIGWIFGVVLGGGIFAIFKVTEGPRIATHDFIRDAAEGRDADALAMTSGISQAQYDDVAQYIRRQGVFVDTTFRNTQIVNDRGEVEGIATFGPKVETPGAGVTRDVTAKLRNVGGGWKVTEITIR